MSTPLNRVTIGISGASGVILAINLINMLLRNDYYIDLVITKAGIVTINEELDLVLSNNLLQNKKNIFIYLNNLSHDKIFNNEHNLFDDKLSIYNNYDWYAPIASGSSVNSHMIICPCSMATLGKIANGIGDDLLCRATDVILKERKNLIIVPREMPFNSIHLANMLKLSQMGVSITPPIPAFYTKPSTIQDIIDFIVGKILDQIGPMVHNPLVRWATKSQEITI